ncbi:MAG: hypothetical protein KDK39_10715, partial [Leptospiraceae bacterium]|nr:hypothetical protein [Leptospiraceae bacterium]
MLQINPHNSSPSADVLDPVFQEVRQRNREYLAEFDAGFWVTLRSVVYWIIMLCITLVLGLVAVPLAILRLSRAVHFVATLWGNLILMLFGTRIHLHGAENLYTGPSSLVCANHQSISDIFIFYAVLKGIQFRWMAKA